MALRARLRRRSRGSGVHRRAVRRRRGNPVGACRAPPGWRPSGTRRSATGAWSARGPGRVVAVESLPDQPPHELAQRHARVDVGEQPLELLQSTLALCVDDRLDLPAPLAQRPHPIGRHRQCGVHVGQHLRHLPGAHAGRLLHQRLLRRQVQHRSRLGFRLPFSRPCRPRSHAPSALASRSRRWKRSRRSKAACNCAAASRVKEPSQSRSRTPSILAQSFMALILRQVAASL